MLLKRQLHSDYVYEWSCGFLRLDGQPVTQLVNRRDTFSLSRERAQTSCADVDAAVLTVDQHPFALDVGPEHTLGRAHGVAPVVAKHRALATDFALCHVSPHFRDNLHIIPYRCWKAT